MNIATLIQDFHHIVLIDDDHIHNMITKKVLQKFYHSDTIEIVEFEDAKESLEYLRNQPASAFPILVFLDLQMPVLSGWDVLEELNNMKRATVENITLLLLTSSIDDNDKLRAKQYSLVNGFLAKPLTLYLS